MGENEELAGFTAEQKLSIYKYIKNVDLTEKNFSGFSDGMKNAIEFSMSEQSRKQGERFQKNESRISIIENIIGDHKKLIIGLMIGLIGLAFKIVFKSISE